MLRLVLILDLVSQLMARQVSLVLVALCALLRCACSCEFEAHEARAPEPLQLSSALETWPDADADSCRARCCAREACDAAVLAFPQDARAQCFLLSCGGACALREDNDSQYKVFTRLGAHAHDTSLKLVPLMLGASTRTEEQRNNTNATTADVCTLPPVVGLCKAAFPRYYFHTLSGSCRQFIYGGCGGNKNNFESQDECEATCAGVKGAEEKPQNKMARMAPPLQTELSEDDTEETPENKEMTQEEYSELCLAPPVVGRCRAAFPRWFFNSSSGRCERFTYGGCSGNKNNHETEGLCSSTCTAVTVQSSKKHIPETSQFKTQCSMAPDSGPCRAAFPRFYFDPETQSCKRFIYGGCKGNENRYGSEDECTENCVNAGENYEGHSKSHWTTAFCLFLVLAAISFLLLTALIVVTLKRRRYLSIRSDREELLPDSERSSVDSLPLPESPSKA